MQFFGRQQETVGHLDAEACRPFGSRERRLRVSGLLRFRALVVLSEVGINDPCHFMENAEQRLPMLLIGNRLNVPECAPLLEQRDLTMAHQSKMFPALPTKGVFQPIQLSIDRIILKAEANE